MDRDINLRKKQFASASCLSKHIQSQQQSRTFKNKNQISLELKSHAETIQSLLLANHKYHYEVPANGSYIFHKINYIVRHQECREQSQSLKIFNTVAEAAIHQQNKRMHFPATGYICHFTLLHL